MYAIETELGRFEGETEKDAKRKLRAAEKKHAAEHAAKQKLAEAARTRARLAALYLLERVVRQETIEAVTPETANVTRIVALDDGLTTKLEVWTNDGEAAMHYWLPVSVHAVILNCGGWPLAILMGDNERQWHAVGGCDGVLALYAMDDGIKAYVKLPDSMLDVPDAATTVA